MGCRALGGVLCLWASGLAWQAQEADPLLERIRERMKANFARMPDYVCHQTVERSLRGSPRESFKVRDTLRLEVGVAGDKEIFAWRDASRFSEKDLADMVGSGTIGYGSFVLHARHVLGTTAAEYTPRGEEMLEGRRTIRYDYEVPRERSGYRIRVHPRQGIVGFRGSFWVDAETLDLARLEVIASDIPPDLGVALATEVMDYGRVEIGSSDFLLPRASELWMAGVAGEESRNRTLFHDCRQYTARSTVSFAGSEPGARAQPGLDLASGTALELTLNSEIDLEKAALGDPVEASVKPLKSGGSPLIPPGAVARGRLVRLDRETMPQPHFVIGIEFDTLEFSGASTAIHATMVEAGPASGLIRQEKRFMPTFKKSRSPKLGILVQGQQRGQGVLVWDARRPRVPRGLRMRWETSGEPAR